MDKQIFADAVEAALWEEPLETRWRACGVLATKKYSSATVPRVSRNLTLMSQQAGSHQRRYPDDALQANGLLFGCQTLYRGLPLPQYIYQRCLS